MAGAAPRRYPLAVNGRVALGIESFRLEPANIDFYLMASAESPKFIQIVREVDGEQERLVNQDGSRLAAYPDHVQFRLTASAREKSFEDHPWDTKSDLPVEDVLSKLRFRIKVFHGLQYRYIEPESINDIGMPRDVPYDERIYEIGFTLGKVPIEDRIVLEVFSPSGERLCKFHLDLI